MSNGFGAACMRSSWVVVGARRHLCATFVNAGEALDADNVHATRMKVNPNPNPMRERERGQEVRATHASTFRLFFSRLLSMIQQCVQYTEELLIL